MRTIKFRIWNGEEMIYDPVAYWIPDKYTYNINDILSQYDSEPMQFTGLLDKNGKEIYEGDIVKFEEKCYGVYRDEEYLEYYIMNGENNEPMHSCNHYEIIDNIHENSELLNS